LAIPLAGLLLLSLFAVLLLLLCCCRSPYPLSPSLCAAAVPRFVSRETIPVSSRRRICNAKILSKKIHSRLTGERPFKILSQL
jgi:hypothetical protein